MKSGAAVDWVAGNEFDFTVQEVADGRAYEEIDGLAWRRPNGC